MSVRRNTPAPVTATVSLLPAVLRSLIVEDWVTVDDADEARRRSWFINGTDQGTAQLAQSLKIVAGSRHRRARAQWASGAGVSLAALNTASPPPRALFRDYAAFAAELGATDAHTNPPPPTAA
ncbi:MAG: hypothetical protein ACR2GF_02775 [Acidimicrobiales bacterium]